MKNRKPKTPVRKRAPRRPAQSRAAPSRAAKSRAAQHRPAGASEAAPSGEASLDLATECTVAEADSLKARLMRLLDDARAVTLDVSALQRIDTAGLQLLAAFVRDRRTAGRRIEWRGRAPALDAAAGLLGLSSMLELPGEDGR